MGLRKEEDDVPPRKGDVIGNGTVLAWHGTLEKLTKLKALLARRRAKTVLELHRSCGVLCFVLRVEWAAGLSSVKKYI